ncbi:unnamed protein product [Cuscuta campestris]|uniref:feruloyl-CoA 6-hydroxylase n=1 Tax=Cuscuta campestris TaxID=132261 RepID=A0A484KHC1_9ASTE|nr:unnamed protein product [Cuscuta campestris]
MDIPNEPFYVEDVQELVRKAQLSSSSSSPASSVVIPERFVKGGTAPGADTRPTVVVPAAYSSSSSSSSSCGGDDHHEEEEQQQQEEYTIKIPVIDLSKLLITSSVDGVNSPLFLDELSNLSHACQHWGFFQVVNHGVEKGLLEKMERLAMEFFMQPVEEKRKYAMAPGGIQGETVETYTREMRGLCEKLMKYIGITLNGNDDVFDRAFAKGCVQAVRMNYYPPCPRPDLVLGLSPHSDGSALTVLQQPNFGPPGLQILNDKNEWVQVPSLPNALVINVGDTIEVFYCSIKE